MILTVLLLLLCIASLLQSTSSKLYSAVLFSSLALGHEVLFSDLDGLIYYSSDALLQLVFIYLSSRIEPTNTLTLYLQKIAIVIIVLDIIGWIAWTAYAPPTLYNFSFLLTYSATIIILIHNRDSADVGSTADSRWLPGIRLNIASRNLHSD